MTETLEQIAERIARNDHRMMQTAGSVLEGTGLLGIFNSRIHPDFADFFASRRDQYLEEARQIIAQEARA